MRYIDQDNSDRRPSGQIDEDDRFNFCCHPEIGCFNRCCRNLNLFLYPYDVIRLKSCLGLSSDRFLEKYVHVIVREGNYLPDILLTMSENRERTCPFLTRQGCTVYVDRPDACRTFPVEQGNLYDARLKKSRLLFFFRPPEFCLGQHEQQTWSTAEWARDQEAETYNRMTLLFADLKRLFQNDPWGQEGPEGPRAKMAFMATYNVDRFREFVFGSSFLSRYKVKATLLKKARRDDVELMKLGFKWVKLFLWGMGDKTIRPKR